MMMMKLQVHIATYLPTTLEISASICPARYVPGRNKIVIPNSGVFRNPCVRASRAWKPETNADTYV